MEIELDAGENFKSSSISGAPKSCSVALVSHLTFRLSPQISRRDAFSVRFSRKSLEFGKVVDDFVLEKLKEALL
jgi:hypothetical protein